MYNDSKLSFYRSYLSAFSRILHCGIIYGKFSICHHFMQDNGGNMRFNNSDRHSVRLCVGSIYRRGHTYRHIYRITYLRQMVVPALRQALRPKDMVYEQMSALQSRSRRGQTRISDLFCRGAEKNGLRRFIDPCSSILLPQLRQNKSLFPTALPQFSHVVCNFSPQATQNMPPLSCTAPQYGHTQFERL